MPFGLGEIPLMGDVWAARPKPVSTLWKGIRAGAPIGAAAGLWAGGPVGAAVGAGIGTALGTVTAAATRLAETMKRLEGVTRNLIEQYKAYSPAIARMRHQWRLLDRRLNRIWAETLAPTLKKLTDIGTEFKERWTKMKVEFFEAIEPHLTKILDFVNITMRITLEVFGKLIKAITVVIDKLTWLGRKLGWFEEEKERKITRALIPYGMDWPAVEGPLTGAMRRAGLTELPFTTERRPPTEKREGESEAARETRELYEKGLLQGQPGEDIKWPIRELPKDIPGFNININVGDSKELSAVFEHVWHETTYALRKLEAETDYQAYLLQQEATYT